ncbi:MAG: hypothetical protein AAB425_09705 [Bdellovibrionota bacterium]
MILGASLGFFTNPAWAKPDRNIGFAAVAGVPRLLGVDLSYVGAADWISFGASFGSLPVDRLINSKVPLPALDMGTLGTEAFELVPQATYRFFGTTGYLRLFPGWGGFFTELAFSYWTFSGTVSLNLHNKTQDTSVAGVASGTLKIYMPALAPAFGYEFKIGPGFFVDVGLGVMILLKPSYSISMGGRAADFLPIVSEAESAYEDAKSTLDQEISSALSELQATLPVLPGLFLTVGYAF